jgi:hypothetical protein
LIFNLILGHYPQYFSDYAQTDFALLQQMINFSSKNAFSGIYIDFSSSKRLERQIYPNMDLPKDYKMILSLPLVALTIDQGFFKQNVTLHCSRSNTTGKRQSDDEVVKWKEEEEKLISEEGEKKPLLQKNSV